MDINICSCLQWY